MGVVEANKYLKREGLFARCDLSKEDQKKDFALRQELKVMKAKHPEANFKIKNSKVVKI
jgi:hypothetical protein